MIRFKFLMILALFLPQSIFAQDARVVRVKPGFATVIVCPAEPEIVTIGNSQQFSVQNSGHYVLVKPLIADGSTNMFIKAAGESFNLVLQVAEKADLEIHLRPKPLNGISPAGDPVAVKNPDLLPDRPEPKPKDHRISKRARQILNAYYRTPRRYTFSVENSNVILAVDHLVQIEDKLAMICTIVNNSKIPYDIGFVRFKIVEKKRSYLFFRRRVKENELEPVQERHNQKVAPKSRGRLLFIFEKHGLSNKNSIEIKCIEESGRRDLVLEVPGTFVE